MSQRVALTEAKQMSERVSNELRFTEVEIAEENEND